MLSECSMMLICTNVYMKSSSVTAIRLTEPPSKAVISTLITLPFITLFEISIFPSLSTLKIKLFKKELGALLI